MAQSDKPLTLTAKTSTTIKFEKETEEGAVGYEIADLTIKYQKNGDGEWADFPADGVTLNNGDYISVAGKNATYCKRTYVDWSYYHFTTSNDADGLNVLQYTLSGNIMSLISGLDDDGNPSEDYKTNNTLVGENTFTAMFNLNYS